MSQSPFSTAKFRYVFAACWLLLVIVHIRLIHWYGLTIEMALVDGVISNVFLMGVCILVSNLFSYYLPSKQRYSYILVKVAILTIAWLLVTRVVLMLVFTEDAYKHFFTQSIPIRAAIGFLIIGEMALLSVLWYTSQDQQENEKRRSEAERLAKEAELFKLRQQLQPHFLFNSLNSINALIGLKPQEARKMIQQLSDFLRGTLKKEDNVWTSLEEELQHLQLYLEIEKVRFGHRLNAGVENVDADMNAKLPALILQPIVENAIKFGLYDTIDDISICIKATQEGDLLIVSVQNPFDPETSTPKGTGFGLSSVQRRLYLLFGRNDLLQTAAKENIFITTVKIPQPHVEGSNNR